MTRDRTFLVFALMAAATFAQSPALAFEVATVKPSGDLMTWSGFQFPGSERLDRPGLTTFFEASHVTVKAVVAFAYDVRDSYVSGGPSWAGGDRFDIVAK